MFTTNPPRAESRAGIVPTNIEKVDVYHGNFPLLPSLVIVQRFFCAR